MKKTPEQVKKLVETYLSTEYVHKFPIVEITQEVVSTYDGDYPSFVIDYNGSNPNDDDELWNDLVEGIKKYTNLKQGEDYWLGLRWSWNSYGIQ
jgi:hypothetical protein